MREFEFGGGYSADCDDFSNCGPDGVEPLVVARCSAEKKKGTASKTTGKVDVVAPAQRWSAKQDTPRLANVIAQTQEEFLQKDATLSRADLDANKKKKVLGGGRQEL